MDNGQRTTDVRLLFFLLVFAQGDLDKFGDQFFGFFQGFVQIIIENHVIKLRCGACHALISILSTPPWSIICTVSDTGSCSVGAGVRVQRRSDSKIGSWLWRRVGCWPQASMIMVMNSKDDQERRVASGDADAIFRKQFLGLILVNIHGEDVSFFFS